MKTLLTILLFLPGFAHADEKGGAWNDIKTGTMKVIRGAAKGVKQAAEKVDDKIEENQKEDEAEERAEKAAREKKHKK